MLAVCVNDGLTIGSRVYKKGEIFTLPSILEGDFGEVSDDAAMRKQTRIYGKAYFRKATNEEIIEGFHAGLVSVEQLSAKEKYMIGKAAEIDKRKREEALEALAYDADLVEDEESVVSEPEEPAVEEDEESVVSEPEEPAVEEDEESVEAKPVVERKPLVKRSSTKPRAKRSTSRKGVTTKK